MANKKIIEGICRDCGERDDYSDVDQTDDLECLHCGSLNVEEDKGDSYCGTCNGTGEGMHDGSICNSCKGFGNISEIDDDYEPDFEIEFESEDHIDY